jgi:hypothetical protein
MNQENFTGDFEKRKFLSEEGVQYIAFGDAFTLEGIMSYHTLREHCPTIPVCFMTDNLERLEGINDPYLLKVKIEPQHIRSKVDFIKNSPFKKTLYLDSDTVVVRDISDIFQSLDRFDVALTHDYARKRTKYSKIVPEYAVIPYSFSEVNGGVFAFNANLRTQKFLELWEHYFYKYYHQTNGWDQVSLRISLWESEVALYHLPFEYNIRSKANREKQDTFKHEFGEQHLAPRIYHLHYDNEVHRGEFKYEVDQLEDFKKKIIEQAVEY